MPFDVHDDGSVLATKIISLAKSCIVTIPGSYVISFAIKLKFVGSRNAPCAAVVACALNTRIGAGKSKVNFQLKDVVFFTIVNPC